MRKVKRQKLKNDIAFKHIIKNEKQYLISILFFLVGLILGIIIFNNSDIIQKNELSQLLKLNIQENIINNPLTNFYNSLKLNLVLIAFIWVVGSTVIGIAFILGIVAIRGFCFGYTICSLIYTLGVARGTLFSLTSLMFHNILFIPALFIATVSCLNLCKYIFAEKNTNFKLLLVKHTSICFLVLLLFTISSFIEIYISKFLTIKVLDYIKF